MGVEKGGRGQCDCWVWYLKFNSKSTPRNLDNHPQFGAIYAWLPLLVKFRTANSFLRETFAERCECNKRNFRIGFKPIKLVLSEIF